MKAVAIASLVLLITAGCAATKSDPSPEKSESTKPSHSAWPDWVLNPAAKGGLAGADCVQASGNIGLDRQHAATNARRNIAQEMKVGVKGMDEAYAERRTDGATTASRTTFESRAQAIIDTTLTGSKITRVEEITHGDGRWVCAEVRLHDTDVRGFVSQVVVASGEAVAPQTEELLLERFRARTAKAAQNSQ